MPTIANPVHLGRILVSALGAVAMSTVCLLGAAAPARAATPTLTIEVVAATPATGLVGAVRY